MSRLLLLLLLPIRVVAQPVLVQAPDAGALDIIWARSFAGSVPARTRSVSPSREIVTVVIPGLTGVGESELKAALSSLFRAAKTENFFRLAILSDRGVQFAGPFRARRDFDAAVAEASEVARSSKPPAVEDVPRAFASLAGSWRTIVLIGMPQVTAELSAYTATYLSHHFRQQKLRIAFWPAATVSDWARAVARSTGGAVLPELAEVVGLVSREPQAYAEVDWTAPKLTAGFHAHSTTLLRRDGTSWSQEDAVATASGFDLPDPERYAKLLTAQGELVPNPPDPERARGALNTVLSINPRDRAALRWAADFHRRLADFGKAATMLSGLTELTPGDPSLWAELGGAYAAANDPTAAEAALLKSWELKPGDTAVAERLGRIRLGRGDAHGAIPFLDAALKGSPGKQEIWFLRADAATRINDADAAAVALEKGLALGGDHLDRRTTLVRRYLDKGATGQAIAQIELVLPNLPQEAGMRATYAGFLETAGRTGAALTLWRDVIAAAPRDETAYASAGRLLIAAGDLDGAVHTIDAGVNATGSPRLYALRAAIFEKAGDLYAARSALRKAAAQGVDAETLERLAVMEDTFGRRGPEAYAALASALEKTAPRSAAHITALQRGHAVSLRDGDDENTASFASRLRAAGRQVREPPVAAQAGTEQDVWVRGGLDALAFIAHSPRSSPPERFFVDYARAILRQTQHATDSVRQAYIESLCDYFERLVNIERSGTTGKTVTVPLSLADSNSRRETTRILDLLGWKVESSRGKLVLSPGDKVSAARRQETASALAIDEVAMKEALEAGKPFNFEIGYERAVVTPGENIWRDAFYPGKQYPGGFAEALARDPRAAKLYAALSGLDSVTLSALVSGIGLKKLGEQYADLMYRYSSALASDAKGIFVPGGTAAEPVWTKLSGASPRQPAQFLRSLLDKDDGKLFAFFFTLGQLDALHQRFFTSSITRAMRFYELLKDAPEYQRGAEALIRNASLSEFFRGVPLEPDGTVRFPGSPEVWMVAKGTSGAAGASTRLFKRLAKAAAPDIEDEILIRLAKTRYSVERERRSELDNFLAAVQIDSHRTRPLTPESALILAQQYARYEAVYPYFALLTGLEQQDFTAFARFADAVEQRDEVLRNALLGEWHSIVAMLSLLESARMIDSARAAARFHETCEAFTRAQQPGESVRAALGAVRSLLGSLSGQGGPDERIRNALLGTGGAVTVALTDGIRDLDPSAARHAAFRKVLELQNVTSLETLFAIFDAADGLVKGNKAPAEAIRTIEQHERNLLNVPVPDEVRFERTAKDCINSYRPKEIAKILRTLKQRASKKKISQKDLAKAAEELIAELNPQVLTALAGIIYARYLDPSDLLVADDPLLLRKHQFFAFAHKQFGAFPRSTLQITSDRVGTYVTGGFADFASTAGGIAIVGVRPASSASEAAALAQLAVIRAADYRALRQEDFRLLGLTIRIAREWIIESAHNPALSRELADETLGLLGLARRRDLLDGIANERWRRVWPSVTLSDLYFLGRRFLGRHKEAPWPSPVMRELQHVSAGNDGSRLNALGAVLPDLFGCSHPHLLEQAPYEEFERYLFPTVMAQRSAELVLCLADAMNTAGLPPSALPAIAPAVTRAVVRKFDMADIRDWRSVAGALEKINEQSIAAALDQR